MKSLFESILEADQSHLKYRFKQKYDELYAKINHTITPKHSILVVSMCGEKKEPSSKKEKVLAREMYLGPANQTLLKSLPELPVDWVIFSGGYGLMSQTAKINYYTDVIMDLTKEKLREMSDYLRYQRDLKKILEKGHYKKVIFTISDRWMYTLDLAELQEAAGKGCEFITFLSQDRMDQEDFTKPSNHTNIVYKNEYFEPFGATRLFLKEKIVTQYLQYIHDNSDIDIKEFIRRKVK